MKRIFTRKDRREAKKEIEPLPNVAKLSELPKAENADSHNFSFGVVYANDLAKAELEKENPQFPAGAIIVREKLATAASEIPLTVIAMVKREKGFSEKTGDWEFLF